MQIFHEIDAVEPLKKIASSPNTVASKLAAEALKNIGEKIPHKLSQQVPLWTVDDVVYWITQVRIDYDSSLMIGFLESGCVFCLNAVMFFSFFRYFHNFCFGYIFADAKCLEFIVCFNIDFAPIYHQLSMFYVMMMRKNKER